MEKLFCQGKKRARCISPTLLVATDDYDVGMSKQQQQHVIPKNSAIPTTIGSRRKQSYTNYGKMIVDTCCHEYILDLLLMKQRLVYSRLRRGRMFSCCSYSKVFAVVVVVLMELLSESILYNYDHQKYQCEAFHILQHPSKSLPITRVVTPMVRVRSSSKRCSVYLFASTTTTASLDDSVGAISQQPSSSHDISQERTDHLQHHKQQHLNRVKKKSKWASKKNEIFTLFRQAKQYERIGQWSNAINNYEYILQHLNQYDAHSYLALAKLQTKRQQYDIAQQVYADGLLACPQSIHLLQAYAIYEETITNNITKATELYETALSMDRYNPYVCHAYACMERKAGNTDHAIQLLQLALVPHDTSNKHMNSTTTTSTAAAAAAAAAIPPPPTAAVVCTLGELYILQNQYDAAKQLYEDSISRIIASNRNRHESSQSLSSSESLREQVEVYLAYAWLEERYYENIDRAETLLQKALQLCPRGHNAANMVQIALARFDGRHQQQQQRNQQKLTQEALLLPAISDLERTCEKGSTVVPSSNLILKDVNNDGGVHNERSMDATVRRLASACLTLEQQQHHYRNSSFTTHSMEAGSVTRANDQMPSQQISKVDSSNTKYQYSGKVQLHQTMDGRIYNAWANIEVKARRFYEARKILHRGLIQYPYDHTLLQAMGKVQERLGNYSGAEYYYSESLRIQPSAPTLVAYALFNLHHLSKNHKFTTTETKSDLHHAQTSSSIATNFIPKFTLNETKRLFEEALMIDRRHGPAYNAFARTVVEYENDYDMARSIYKRGIHANCTDMASIYHGYARLELGLGNIELARSILIDGQQEVNRINIGTDSPHRERAVFLTHTLGMIELNYHRPLFAYDVFIDGINRYGNSSQLLLGAALTLVKLGNEYEARDYFEQAVRADSKHAQAWQAWGMMEMRSGNYKTSKALLECGIRSTPRYGPLWHAYGILESRMGNVEMARTLYEKGIDVAPDHVGLYQSWATLEVREENYSVAKALIARALTRDKHNGVGWLIAADIEERMGHHGLSLLVLRRGIECSVSGSNINNSARLYRALGDALVRQGKIGEAREALEQGIAIDPLYAPLYHSLAELEARVGNVEELAKLNKRTAVIFSANSTLPTPNSSKTLWKSSDVTTQRHKQSRNTDVRDSVSEIVKRIVPEDDDSITASNYARRQTESTAFLDNLMSSYCLDDEGLISELVQGFEDI